MSSVLIVHAGENGKSPLLGMFEQLGLSARICDDPREVTAADYIVLSGSESFGLAVVYLRSRGFEDVLIERVSLHRPLLAIGLGFQLLFAESAESPGVDGLGIFPGKLEVPTGYGTDSTTASTYECGWAKVHVESGCRIISEGTAYFQNHYSLYDPPSKDVRCAFSDRGERIVAGFEKDSLVACQFQPELSDQYGLTLMQRWMKTYHA